MRPSRRKPYSSGRGSFTFTTISAPQASSRPTSSAPARAYSASESPEPSPAPRSTSTVWPRLTRLSTPPGVRATRFSKVLISLGTPITMATPPSQTRAVF